MLAGMIGQFKILLPYLVQLRGIHFLQVQKLVPRAARRTNDLVELYLQCFGVTVLRVLDQEYHEKSDDRCAGVDHQLPRVRKTEKRPGCGPKQNDRHRSREGRRFAAYDRRGPRKSGKV